MLNVLDDQLTVFDRDARSSVWRDDAHWHALCVELDRLIAFGVSLLEQIEEAGSRDQPADAWSEEAARKWVPTVCAWNSAAIELLETARAFARKGYRPPRFGDLAHAVNRSKFFVNFEESAASIRQVRSGQGLRKWGSLEDELQRIDRIAS